MVRPMLVSILISFTLAAIPIFRWTKYSLDASYTSCGLETKEKSSVSFNVLILFLVYMIPLFLICYAYTRILGIVI